MLSVTRENNQTSILTPPKAKNYNIVNLIGRKALTQCNLNDLAVSALLDTGAQVSIIDCVWKDKYLPYAIKYTCIFVTVDRFSKACKLVPISELPTALETAVILFTHVFRNYGIPRGGK